MRVIDLRPGDLVRQDGMEAVFIAHTAHPLWPGLELVIWRLGDGDGWSLDALRAEQDVGETAQSTSAERKERLREVLLGGSG